MLTRQELTKSPLFQDIRYEDYQRMLDCFQAVQRSYRPDDVIYDFSGPGGNSVGVVERGEAALIRIDQEGVDRVTAAQAADELLSLKGVKASFVVFRSGENVQMSARSLGEINVQVILEALGGGGNSTTAGGRVENTDVETVKTRLLEAIDAYFEK